MNNKDDFFGDAKGYHIEVGSPPDYDKVVVYICIGREEVALVQKEEGDDKMILEFFDEPINTKIYYDVFLKALQEAKEVLLK